MVKVEGSEVAGPNVPADNKGKIIPLSGPLINTWRGRGRYIFFQEQLIIIYIYMEYCKNENLEKIGKHIFGVYPDKCFFCKTKKKEIKLKKSAKKFVSYEDLREEFREETILANNWLKWKL